MTAIDDVRVLRRRGFGSVGTRWTWIREEASETRSWVYRLIAIALALAMAAVYLVTTVHVPDVLGLVLRTTFTTQPGLQELVVLATPFFLTALAAQIPLRVGLWNIGGEGQFFAGAWLACAFAFALPHAPGALLIIGMLVAGAIGGALWVTIPMLAKAFLNVNEIITTLMLNLVVVSWVAYWITGPWQYPSSQGGTIESRFLPVQSHLPLVHLAGGLDSGLIIAVGITIVVGVVVRYSIFGYRTLVVGSGRAVASFAGVPVRRMIAISFLLGGALAGIGGVLQLVGNSYQLTPGLSNNTGYLGIAVAVLAGGSILGVIVMSCLLAVIMSVGQAVQIYGVSSEDVFILIGVLLLLATIAEVAAHHRLVRRPADVSLDLVPVAGVGAPGERVVPLNSRGEVAAPSTVARDVEEA